MWLSRDKLPHPWMKGYDFDVEMIWNGMDKDYGWVLLLFGSALSRRILLIFYYFSMTAPQYTVWKSVRRIAFLSMGKTICSK